MDEKMEKKMVEELAVRPISHASRRELSWLLQAGQTVRWRLSSPGCHLKEETGLPVGSVEKNLCSGSCGIDGGAPNPRKSYDGRETGCPDMMKC